MEFLIVTGGMTLMILIMGYFAIRAEKKEEKQAHHKL